MTQVSENSTPVQQQQQTDFDTNMSSEGGGKLPPILFSSDGYKTLTVWGAISASNIS